MARVDVARANAVCVCAVVIRGVMSAGGGRLPASRTSRADDPRCGARSRWPLQASDVVRSRLSPQVPLLSAVAVAAGAVVAGAVVTVAVVRRASAAALLAATRARCASFSGGTSEVAVAGSVRQCHLQ